MYGEKIINIQASMSSHIHMIIVLILIFAITRITYNNINIFTKGIKLNQIIKKKNQRVLTIRKINPILII